MNSVDSKRTERQQKRGGGGGGAGIGAACARNRLGIESTTTEFDQSKEQRGQQEQVVGDYGNCFVSSLISFISQC